MATYFLSAARHLTLLESNAELIGLYEGKTGEEDERNKQLEKEINDINSEPYY